MTISTQVIPPGGWQFFEAPINLRAPTFPQLAKLLTDHRTANGKPIGNPEQEIMDQIGGKYPDLQQQRQAMMPSMAQQTVSLATAIKEYIRKGGRLVEKNEAVRRAEICAPCHNNHGEISGGIIKKACVSCGRAGVKQLRKMILNGRNTPLDSKLKYCQICGCDLAFKIWLPKEYFQQTPEDSNRWPTFCWMK